MNSLGERNYALISNGLSTTGSYDPSICLGECLEELYCNDIQTITQFLTWVNEDVANRKFGHGNYEERFSEFLLQVTDLKIKPMSTTAVPDLNKMRDNIADFIYTSMCVDGKVVFDSFVDEVVRHGKKLKGMLFEVTDKKRGKFYIAWFY